MSPEQISALISIANLLEMMSDWPFGLALFLFIVGPWMLAVLISYLQKKRFEAVVVMYEKNVHLVKDYDGVAKDLKEAYIMNTQAMTRIIENINSNQFCPVVRLEKQAKGVQG